MSLSLTGRLSCGFISGPNQLRKHRQHQIAWHRLIRGANMASDVRCDSPYQPPEKGLSKMDAKLRVVGGRFSGHTIQVSRGKLLIGRAEDCDLRPESEFVSGYHCVLLLDEYTVSAFAIWAARMELS